LADLEQNGPGDRWLGGVASGVAIRLGVEATIVRLAFVALGFASGVGVVLYGLAWVLLPERETTGGVRPTRSVLPASGDPIAALAFGAVVLGALLLIQQSGLPFPTWVMTPFVVVAIGASMISHESRRSIEHALSKTGSRSWRGQIVRLAVGGVFVFGGLAGVVSRAGRLNALTGLFFAVFALVGGLGVILLPWSRSMLRALSEERRARVRSEEKADIAAHLHDSVLQTLAIIQRKADDPRQVQALARRQERELRAWLFSEGDQTAGRPLSIRELVDVIAEEVEEAYGLNVDVVGVGDAPLDASSRVLLAAMREALVNAGKHSGADKVDVYLELEDTEIAVFVRDRGAGFDPSLVSADRRGLSDSIVGRLARNGGRAVIRSAPGEGTEVQLSIARAAESSEAVDAPLAEETGSKRRARRRADERATT
jgi:signal transduction histidine kinase